jgi:dTDP-4-dehydrorhamnose 3,5-epimerase
LFKFQQTDIYNKQSEGGLLWNDAELGIKWQTSNPIISDKDKVLPLLKDLISPF